MAPNHRLLSFFLLDIALEHSHVVLLLFLQVARNTLLADLLHRLSVNVLHLLIRNTGSIGLDFVTMHWSRSH